MAPAAFLGEYLFPPHNAVPIRLYHLGCRGHGQHEKYDCDKKYTYCELAYIHCRNNNMKQRKSKIYFSFYRYKALIYGQDSARQKSIIIFL